MPAPDSNCLRPVFTVILPSPDASSLRTKH